MTSDMISIKYDLDERYFFSASANVKKTNTSSKAVYTLELILRDLELNIEIEHNTVTGTLPLTCSLDNINFAPAVKSGGRYRLTARLQKAGSGTPVECSQNVTYLGWENYFSPEWKYTYSCQVTDSGNSHPVLEGCQFLLNPGSKTTIFKDPFDVALNYQSCSGKTILYKGSCKIDSTRKSISFPDPIKDAAYQGQTAALTFSFNLAYGQDDISETLHWIYHTIN